MKIPIISPMSCCLILGSMMMTTACQKDLQSDNSDTAAAVLADSSTTADNAYSDGFTNAFYGYSEDVAAAVGEKHSGVVATNGTASGQTVVHFSCATASVYTTGGGYPVTLSLDFGNGCTSNDSITRRGKISYTYSGPIYSSGSSITVLFDNYYVNGYGLQGLYSITNSSSDSTPQFAEHVTNGIFSYPDGSNYHYTSNKVITMTAGASTPLYFQDDVYSISGNSNFSSSSGNSVVLTVTTPLVKNLICPSVSSGIISFVYNTRIKGTIDFGNGDCDNIATLTAGGTVKTIALR